MKIELDSLTCNRPTIVHDWCSVPALDVRNVLPIGAYRCALPELDDDVRRRYQDLQSNDKVKRHAPQLRIPESQQGAGD